MSYHVCLIVCLMCLMYLMQLRCIRVSCRHLISWAASPTAACVLGLSYLLYCMSHVCVSLMRNMCFNDIYIFYIYICVCVHVCILCLGVSSGLLLLTIYIFSHEIQTNPRLVLCVLHILCPMYLMLSYVVLCCLMSLMNLICT